MEYTQLFVFVLLIPVFLQIFLPLAIMIIFSLLRLGARLFGPTVQGNWPGQAKPALAE